MGLSAINPFDDPDLKREILGQSGVNDNQIDSDYPIYDPEDDGLGDFKSIISGAPKIPGGGAIKTVIRDASAIVKDNNESKALELNNSLNDLFTEYNKQYGTDLQIDFNSLSRTLVAVSDPTSSRTLQLFLSKLYGNLRSILILQMISKLSLAIDYILDPQRMLSDGNTTYADKFLICQQILDFVEKLESLKESIIIPGADIELRRIGEQKNNIDLSSENKDTQAITDFMSLFKRENGIE